jgi:hypothetical protein
MQCQLICVSIGKTDEKYHSIKYLDRVGSEELVSYNTHCI